MNLTGRKWHGRGKYIYLETLNRPEPRSPVTISRLRCILSHVADRPTRIMSDRRRFVHTVQIRVYRYRAYVSVPVAHRRLVL